MATSPSTLPEFIASLKHHTNAPLVFSVSGTSIKAGYHVTELKHASVQSIDCGGNREIWDETIVQLLDGNGNDRHMTAKKFSNIAERSQGAIPQLAVGRLRFEYAPKNGPAQVFTAGRIAIGQNQVTVELDAEFAVCKPAQSVVGCCGANASLTQAAGCCAS